MTGRRIPEFAWKLGGAAITVLALVGTTKGLFLLSVDDDRMTTEGPSAPVLDGWGVYHATVDPGGGDLP